MQRNNLFGLVMATEHEALPFIERNQTSLVAEKPFRVFECETYRLIISGIGKAHAAMASAYLAWHYSHTSLFNLGASGSTLPDRVGNIYHISTIVEIDRPGVLSKKIRTVKPDIIDGFTTASLATQDRPIIDPLERKALITHASLCDMEGAAFIQACRLCSVMGYLFKIVTDTPEHDSDKHIIDNIVITRNDMYDFFIEKVLPLARQSPPRII